MYVVTGKLCVTEPLMTSLCMCLMTLTFITELQNVCTERPRWSAHVQWLCILQDLQRLRAKTEDQLEVCAVGKPRVTLHFKC